MIFNDTTNRQGLIQDAEDICGLGATGITGNTSLFQQFTRWMNIWNKIGASYVILSFDGHDFDDPNYTTLPSGTLTGTTNRDYNLDPTYLMLKFKKAEVTYDGTNYQPASILDDRDYPNVAFNDPNVDKLFSSPYIDLTASGFKLYPKFTPAQIAAGAKVWVEFYRAPREFATSGTDNYTPGFDFQFHRLPSLGASFEYAKLYKPDLMPQLRADIYGTAQQRGMLKEMQQWYVSKSPSNGRFNFLKENNQ